MQKEGGKKRENRQGRRESGIKRLSNDGWHFRIFHRELKMKVLYLRWLLHFPVRIYPFRGSKTIKLKLPFLLLSNLYCLYPTLGNSPPYGGVFR